MGGGLFGRKIGLSTISSVLASHPLMSEISSVPCALGSVSPLVTEQVESYCNSKSRKQTTDRFSTLSLKNSHLLWSYLGSLFRGKQARTEFLLSLWQEGAEEHSIDPKDPLFAYISQIIEGNLKKAMETSNLHAISMAIASIHSAEHFRQSILLFANQVGKPCDVIPESLLLDVVRVTLTAFASSSAHFSNEQLSLWKLYVPLIASLVKPEVPTASGGGVGFLNHLADQLAAAGEICASHLCVLLSGKRYSLDSVDSSDSIISLLGANHRDVSHYYRLLDPPAMHLSEIFEYAQRTRKIDFFVPLQPWKYAYACFLAADLGMFEIAQKYVQVINAFVRAVPTGKYSVHFRNGLRDLENRMAMGTPQQEAASLGSLWSSLWS